MNMDETPISHEYLTPAGNVIHCTRKNMRFLSSFYQRVNRSRTRRMSTLAAFICSDAALQQHMPQILVPKRPRADRLCTAAEYAKFGALPAPIEVWLGSNGWNNNEIMCKMVTRLRQVVMTHRPGTQVIVLIMDAAPCHIAQKVLQQDRKSVV